MQNIIAKSIVVDVKLLSHLRRTNSPTSHILKLCVRKHEISITQLSRSNRPYGSLRRIREIGSNYNSSGFVKIS